MDTDKTTVTEPKKRTVKEKEAESVYSRIELAKNHRAFNTTYEIVSVALKLAGKESATFNEANKIIEEFKNKEVK